jgi:CubicO group peptidase (beta-lactamase class C family)
MRDRKLPIHSLLIVRDGFVVLDAAFYPYDGSTPHDLASVTKSVTTTLLGIALDQHKLKLNDRVVSFFRDRTIANLDARKARMTVADLASMTSGFSCGPADDERTLRDMMMSRNPVQFTLDLPMAANPGATFSYCSPGMHLLAAIVEKATGLSALEFARQNLFGPLGITDVTWPGDAQGVTHGWGDLRLAPRDAAKLGYLWSNGGRWEGRQIVSTAFVEDALRVHATTGSDDDYGLGWWIARQSPVGEYAAIGRGGQRVSVYPKLNGLIVTTGGGFEPSEATDLITPALLDPEHALPDNPAASASLEAALHRIAEPVTTSLASTPPLAAAVSGRLWHFSQNALGIADLTLDFGTDNAAIRLSFTDGRGPLAGPIGLDGSYRMVRGPGGHPAGLLGAWTGSATFMLELDEITDIDAYAIDIRFSGARIDLAGHDRAGHDFDLSGTPAPGPSDQTASSIP